MLDHEIAEFGRRMGIEGFCLGPKGLAVLTVENFGRVTLELLHGTPTNRDAELLLYVALPIPAHDGDAPRRVLALCAHSQGHPMPVWGGVRNSSLVFLTRLPASSLRAADIENAAKFLRDLLERAL